MSRRSGDVALYPTRIIDSDDPVAADLLASTIGVVLDAGGSIHHAARFIVRDGQLSVSSREADGEPLMEVPADCFVRVDAIGWSDDDPERLQVESMPADASDSEWELAYLQAALHNQCGKLAWLAATHPVIAQTMDDAAVEAFQRLIPGFRSQAMSPRDLLFANRCFRLPWAKADGQRILIPLIDLLDHHSRGATGQWGGDHFAVQGRAVLPDGGCALDYGLARDALQMAAVYGFADDSARIAHCVPVSASIPGFGQVTARGPHLLADGAALPPTAEQVPGGLHLTGVTFTLDVDIAQVWSDILGIDYDDARMLTGALAHANLEALDCADDDLHVALMHPANRVLIEAVHIQSGIVGLFA